MIYKYDYIAKIIKIKIGDLRSIDFNDFGRIDAARCLF